MQSQDTIFKKNKDVIAGKVEEITPSEVKYKKQDNLSGPLYLIPRTEVFRIKYANGFADTLKEEPQTQLSHQNFSDAQTNSSAKKLSTYAKASDKDLHFAIMTLPASDSKEKMLLEYKGMMKYKRTQIISNSVGWGLGFAVPFVVTLGTLGNYDSFTEQSGVGLVVTGALVGAAIRTTGQVLRKINKNKKLKARQNIILLYNQAK